METNHDSSQTRKAAVGSLAVVGFVALILIGIAAAIYAASYIPKALNRLSSANVYLSTLVQPGGEDNQLEAVNPNMPVTQSPAPTSIPLSPAATTTTVVSNPTPTYTPPTPTTPVYQQPTYRRVQVPATYSGLPDLVTTITSVGYLRREGDTNSFVAANTVPSGYQGAVRFVIANRGTNIANNSWTFRAELPTTGDDSTYRSSSQRVLNPNDSIVYTLGFDGATRGSGTIRITADYGHNVSESNENNNTTSQSIYMNGRSSNNDDNDRYDSNGNYCRYGTYRSNNRYYCESSSNSNNNNDDYDSNGNYCEDGTYYSNGRYYCD